MMELQCPAAIWVLLGVQAMGLLSAWFARYSARTAAQAPWQAIFLACLVLVAFATVFGPCLGPGCWLIGGTTLAVMVLSVTCEISHADRAATW